MTSLRWHPGVLFKGHGVASGQALSSGASGISPYPKGTIAMQSPFFAALGLDLSPYWPGTLNLSFAPSEHAAPHTVARGLPSRRTALVARRPTFFGEEVWTFLP